MLYIGYDITYCIEGIFLLYTETHLPRPKRVVRYTSYYYA